MGATEPAPLEVPPLDVILSSGFLAFARHIGFLRGLEELGIRPAALCGTSSGALVGAFWAAGIGLDEMEDVFPMRRPIQRLRLSSTPWHGLFSMEALLGEFRTRLPERLEELPIPFGVGVTGPEKQHRILTAGPLTDSIMASCAVPGLLSSRVLGGIRYRDGGISDRIGFNSWCESRPGRHAIVHEVERSMGAVSGNHEDAAFCWVKSPRSGASLWNLGPFSAQVEETRRLTLEAFRSRVPG